MQDASPANFAHVAGATQVEGKPPDKQVFGSLLVEERVLVTPSRTIAIPNISTISTGTLVETKSPLPFILGIVSGLAALVLGSALASNPYAPSGLSMLVVGLGGLAILFLIYAFRPLDKEHYLIVTSNDGMQTRFTGPHRHTLEEVRDLLTRKINERDERATYNINFEKGIIETLNAGHIRTDAVVQGDNNQLAVNSPSARVASPGDSHTVSASAGAQVGRGNSAKETAVTVTTVNYAEVLPSVEELAAYYRQYPEQTELNEKLDAMLALMQAGTAGPQERSRLRLLALDLGSLLQAYPAMVQLFQHIARMAG